MKEQKRNLIKILHLQDLYINSWVNIGLRILEIKNKWYNNEQIPILTLDTEVLNIKDKTKRVYYKIEKIDNDQLKQKFISLHLCKWFDNYDCYLLSYSQTNEYISSGLFYVGNVEGKDKLLFDVVINDVDVVNCFNLVGIAYLKQLNDGLLLFV